MKNAVRIVLIVFCVQFLCACRPGRAGEFMELSLCGSYSVPGCFCADLRGPTTSIGVLERDEYGRILFEYTAANAVSGEKETSLVICQQRDADYVYFYEDMCYCRGETDEQAVTDLKNRNDWNKPLDVQKMSKRENLITYDLYIHTTQNRLFYGDVIDCIEEYLKLEQGYKCQASFQDISPNGYEMYIVSTSAGRNTTHYIAFISPECEIAFATEIEDIPGAEEIAGMKRTVGWK